MVNALFGLQTPTQTPSTGASASVNSGMGTVRTGVEYALNQAALAPPAPKKPRSIGLYHWMRHPFASFQMWRKLGDNAQAIEPYTTRVAMYKDMENQLSSTGRARLYRLLKAGVLTNTQADDRRSTLSHLYAIATQPRAKGISNMAVLEDVLRLMDDPAAITQRFGNLSRSSAKQMMAYYQSPYAPRINEPITPESLRVTSSATCVSSALMGTMVRHSPSEFVRHIAELTSPELAFYEKVDARDIAPTNPNEAGAILNEYGIPANAMPGSHNQQFWVKVDLPHSGVIRALNQQNYGGKGERGIVESMYQGALTHLVVRSYDPGLDKRINPDGSLDNSKGLEEDRKTLMEAIVKDNGGVMSVTYQFTVSDQQGDPYLVGYFRDFQRTTKDLLDALDMKEDIIIGITDTDRVGTSGRINMGHELLVVDDVYIDKQTGKPITHIPKNELRQMANKGQVKLAFKVMDSDDDISKAVLRDASEIVPKIHHAGYPTRLAHKIQRETTLAQNNQYLTPDAADQRQFKLITTVPQQKQQDFLQRYQTELMQQQAQQATTQVAQAPAAPVQSQPVQPQVIQQPVYIPYPVQQRPVYQPAYYQASYRPNYATAAYARSYYYPASYNPSSYYSNQYYTNPTYNAANYGYGYGYGNGYYNRYPQYNTGYYRAA